MHIELTEMLACPEPHAPDVLVLSTAQMKGRVVQFGLVGCPVCRKEYLIANGVVDFRGRGTGDVGRGPASTPPPSPVPRPSDVPTLQALLDLSGPGGFVVLLGDATRHAAGLAKLMGGIHFIGVNAPAGVQSSPDLSLLVAPRGIPLRASVARGVVVGASMARAPWLEEAVRVLLPGRRLVIEGESAGRPAGVKQLAEGEGVWVGEKG
ncbi:MAG TPA: hypothetical protein VLV16_12220 [Gemmatimonadales bacterium]|nr:hypothetical protein [Gemmatimonadales bacterium]